MTYCFSIQPGLTAVVGEERTGKTSLLRRLSGDLPAQPGDGPPCAALWLDLALTAHDNESAQQVWQALRARSAHWNDALHRELTAALGLQVHQEKPLYMLSTGSRRKVALAGLLACGAAVTCLDQPYAALDQSSIRVIRGFLQDMADHTTRAWVVADYIADPELTWRSVIHLD